MRESQALLGVEVVYALPACSLHAHLRLPAGARLADALTAVAEDARFAALDLEHAVIGIFGKVAGREQLLAQGDRIEIYRALAQDPKIARRARASKSGRS